MTLVRMFNFVYTSNFSQILPYQMHCLVDPGSKVWPYRYMYNSIAHIADIPG